MAGSHNSRIRQGEPWQLRILNWTDSDGNVIDPTGYSWAVQTADGLSVPGVVASGVVSFSLTPTQTAAVKFQRTQYAAEATPIGGDPIRVLAGRIDVDKDPLA